MISAEYIDIYLNRLLVFNDTTSPTPAWIHLIILVPDVPRLFTINWKNLDTVHLKWGKPLEPNGILIGYKLKYQTGELLFNY